jgi:oxygen-independent coproporphyrinogen-3 oxidase
MKVGGIDTIAVQQIPFEFMMNALRLNDGFKVSTFERRTGIAFEAIEPLLRKHESQGLIELSEDLIKPSQFGHNMLNNMLEDFLTFEF